MEFLFVRVVVNKSRFLSERRNLFEFQTVIAMSFRRCNSVGKMGVTDGG